MKKGFPEDKDLERRGLARRGSKSCGFVQIPHRHAGEIAAINQMQGYQFANFFIELSWGRSQKKFW